MEVKLASSDRIPYLDAHFDPVYAVHTLYFWNNPLLHLKEIHRVTRAGGRFVLAFTSKEGLHTVAGFPAAVYRFYSIEETKRFFAEVGFNHVVSRRQVEELDQLLHFFTLQSRIQVDSHVTCYPRLIPPSVRDDVYNLLAPKSINEDSEINVVPISALRHVPTNHLFKRDAAELRVPSSGAFPKQRSWRTQSAMSAFATRSKR
jgi:SAM-dependent methyltransferase